MPKGMHTVSYFNSLKRPSEKPLSDGLTNVTRHQRPRTRRPAPRNRPQPGRTEQPLRTGPVRPSEKPAGRRRKRQRQCGSRLYRRQTALPLRPQRQPERKQRPAQRHDPVRIRPVGPHHPGGWTNLRLRPRPQHPRPDSPTARQRQPPAAL